VGEIRIIYLKFQLAIHIQRELVVDAFSPKRVGCITEFDVGCFAAIDNLILSFIIFANPDITIGTDFQEIEILFILMAADDAKAVVISTRGFEGFYLNDYVTEILVRGGPGKVIFRCDLDAVDIIAVISRGVIILFSIPPAVRARKIILE
jgi:hypothetical protein